MSSGVATVPAARSGPDAGQLGAALGILALGAALLLLLFHAEAAAAVRIWSSSTAYGHCFLVAPVAAWLAWDRRAALAGQAPRPWPWAVLAMLPLSALWFAAERLGVMEARQLVAVAMLLTLVLGVLGWRLWRTLAVPLLYLFFLVPFGGFLVRPLQGFTAGFIDIGLDLLGIPHVVTTFVIEIPEGTFRVAEACAGLRFLIAAIAFGVVYACVLYRSPGRRIAFMLAAIVVPIVANGVRALGIVVLGHLLGSAQAASVDHILYGWLFFSIVIGLLILAGLPFREDRDRRRGTRTASRGGQRSRHHVAGTGGSGGAAVIGRGGAGRVGGAGAPGGGRAERRAGERRYGLAGRPQGAAGLSRRGARPPRLRRHADRGHGEGLRRPIPVRRH